MSELTIALVDPFDAEGFDLWHAAYAEGMRFGREGTAAVWTLEELRVQMQDPHPRAWRVGYAGTVDGLVVTTGFLAGSNLDNLDLCDIAVTTVPDARGRGHGSTMLVHLESVAVERGRSTLTTEVAWPYDADPQGAGHPDVRFAQTRGYVLGLVDIQRQLALPVPDALLDELAAEAAPHHAAYTVRSFVGPIPDELVQGWAELSASLMTEAPTGELQREPEKPDVDALRAQEDVIEKQGRTKFNTAALDADGSVVAYTDIAVTVHESERAYQWGTLVRADHRGHRLGMAVKVANLRQLQAAGLPVTTVITYNAEVNGHMIGVNERMGFRSVERLGEFQKKLG